MKNHNFHRVILFGSGLIAAGFGAVILFSPTALYASSGIEMVWNVSLLNEIRAAGGGLLGCGLFIMAGTFISRFTYTATIIAVLMYLSYGLSRLFSMSVDGMPVESLVMAMGMELLIGLLCIYLLTRNKIIK
ncbi:MAG: DUF4345 domain-containing protein [Gammaproteobacteria bacterium]|nr:DUF4345 domain-containing protein [Gammaproteobacteria bacterium]